MTIEQLPAAERIATETALKEAGQRRWLGKSINRVEDPRFLRGEGRYIDDISLPGMAHAAIVRSPHAHARIVFIDTSRAEALPGVVRVVTGADVTAHAAPLPSFGAGPIIQDLIAIEKVRHYGETVAAVIAESRYVAEDACDLIEVVYEELPVVLVILLEISVEKNDRCASHHQSCGAHVYVSSKRLHDREIRLALRSRQRRDRSMRCVELDVAVLLPPIDSNELVEVARAIKNSNTDERDAKIRC